MVGCSMAPLPLKTIMILPGFLKIVMNNGLALTSHLFFEHIKPIDLLVPREPKVTQPNLKHP